MHIGLPLSIMPLYHISLIFTHNHNQIWFEFHINLSKNHNSICQVSEVKIAQLSL